MLLTQLLNSLGSGITLGRVLSSKLLVNGIYLSLDGVFKRNTITVSFEMLAFLLSLCLVKFKIPFWKIVYLLKDLTTSQVKLVVVMIIRQEERSVTGLYPLKDGTKPTFMV